MAHQITISDELFKKIQSHAVPLVDTIETALVRIIENYEASEAKRAIEGVRIFDNVSPPNLGHTTVMHVTLEGKALRPADTYWNNIFVAVIKFLAEQGNSTETILACIASNKVPGEKTDNGYKYIKEAGLSVQGLDANSAWRSIYQLCTPFGLGLEVTFRWQSKEGVEMPGEVGRFVLKSVGAKSFKG